MQREFKRIDEIVRKDMLITLNVYSSPLQKLLGSAIEERKKPCDFISFRETVGTQTSLEKCVLEDIRISLENAPTIKY